jgi:hypothetical protein
VAALERESVLTRHVGEKADARPRVLERGAPGDPGGVRLRPGVDIGGDDVPQELVVPAAAGDE